MSTIFQWVWMVPALPLAGFLANGVALVALGMVTMGSLTAAFIWFTMSFSEPLSMMPFTDCCWSFIASVATCAARCTAGLTRKSSAYCSRCTRPTKRWP